MHAVKFFLATKVKEGTGNCVKVCAYSTKPF